MIFIDSVKSKPHGDGKYESVVLYADTKAEVPETGAATSALIEGTPDLPPSTIIYTASCEVAILNTSDTWVWKE